MRAGFARTRITPPVGTTMYGFGSRDRERGCEGVHDDLYARALYLSDGGEAALIVGLDLLFLGRGEADRYKGAIGNRLDLSPRQILLNTSHTHSGPMVGTTWAYADYGLGAADPFYADELEGALVEAALRAREAAVEVTTRAGAGVSSLPVSRRRPDGRGGVEWAPHREGEVCRHLPVCLLEDGRGEAVCLLFSVSCHPSTTGGFEISADFPGTAMAALDERLGRTCSLFLQGAGGDTKASVIGQGDQWRRGTWEDIAAAGRTVADEVGQVLDGGLEAAPPGLDATLQEMQWPLQSVVGRGELDGLAADGNDNEIQRLWARRQLERLDRGQSLRHEVPVLLHTVELGPGLRLAGLEGEAVGGLGLHMLRHFEGQGVTFPLGYCDGMAMYLPTTAMLDEGGYEVVSFHEYGQPGPLAAGMEAIISEHLEHITEREAQST